LNGRQDRRPDTGQAHAKVDDGGRKPRADISRRASRNLRRSAHRQHGCWPEIAASVIQRPGSRPVDRLHEAAQRDYSRWWRRRAFAHTILFARSFRHGIVSAVSRSLGRRSARAIRRIGAPVRARRPLGRDRLAYPLTLSHSTAKDAVVATRVRRPQACDARGELSKGLRLVPVPALVIIACAAHAIGQPAGARPLDHACRDSGHTVLALRLIYGEFGLPRLRCRRGLATTIVDLGMCLACVGSAMLPSVQEVPRPRPLLAPDWRCSAVCSRSARRSRARCCGIRRVAAAALLMGLLGTTALAPIRSPSRCVDPVRGRSAFSDGGDRACRHAAGRRDSEATRLAGMAAITLGAGFMAAMTLIWRSAATSFRCCFLDFETPVAGRQPLRLAAMLLAVAPVLHRRRNPTVCSRRAARPERHPHAASVRRPSASGRSGSHCAGASAFASAWDPPAIWIGTVDRPYGSMRFLADPALPTC